jgi:bifunctional non-homologous end joining protein LigD
MATKKSAAKKSPAKKTAAKASKKPKQTASDAVDEQLARYRSMRDFAVTAEPSGTHAKRPPHEVGAGRAEDAVALPFCIQKHAASHLHYDFRLGWNGVLKSWACAKGPSYNVKDRRLAVQVEDHPIDYGGFEGIIPAGQYGGGTVMLWDQGTWQPQAESSDVDRALREGHLKFLLHGTKLNGKWALIRMHPRTKSEETKPAWLLIKEHDVYERPPDAPAITDEAPDSVITGRSLDQIAANEDHVWQSNRPEKQPTKRVPQVSTLRPGKEPPRPSNPPDLDLNTLPQETQPTFLKPQLAQETQSPPEGTSWIHELKLDGYRVQGRKSGTKVALLTRSGLDWTARMRPIADELLKLPVDSVTLDGEVVVLAPDGTTNFADLQAAFQEGARNPLTYFCFDLLHLNDHNPRDLPLLKRKELLAEVLKSADSDRLQLSEHIVSNGAQLFRKACEHGAEGIVSKRADAPYTGTRSTSWLKSKCLHEQEFVIGGYTLPGKGNAGGPGLGALLLGYYDGSGKNLIYAGRTGTGFTHKFAAELRKRLEELETKTMPFLKLTAEARKGALWVQPTMVAQVRFATWTADQQVRQAAFLGLREDKPAAEIRRETAAPTPKSSKARVPHAREASVGIKRSSTFAANSGSAQPPQASDAAKPSHAARQLDHPPIRLTHPQKILDNETRLTKQQLADFYWAVAERMLPHIADRPLSLVRCPDGSEKTCFFQKHVNHMLPPGIGSVDVADKKGVVEPYITLNTPEALAGLAQMGVLEVHPWGSHNQSLEQPDRITIDLDPDEALPWSTLTAAALDVRKRLKSLKLESWVKTTGGKGLHVVVPIQPQQQWPEIKEWAHRFVLAMERENPSLYLTRMTKAARTGKIYLDYLRNERGATAVAPYSPRARKGAPVSVPLAWSELKSPDRPTFRVSNFAEWSTRLHKKDVWADLLRSTQALDQRKA